MFTRTSLISLSLCFSAACASAPGGPAEAPGPLIAGPDPAVVLPADPPKDKQGGPFEVGGLNVEEWLPMLKGPLDFAEVSLKKSPKGVLAPPKECQSWASRKAKKKPTCQTREQSVTELDLALQQDKPEERDQALVELEACVGMPAGFVRSLRSEFAPLECADALIQPFLDSTPQGLDGALKHALVGQAIAGRLQRTAQDPPVLKPPFSKARAAEFSKGPMKNWMSAQAEAIQELSATGASLSYYGKALVALAAGTADLRIVDVVRQAPIPDEFRTDPELADAYFASLDERLEPRKTRGRDAALVGLREMAHAGLIFDGRVVAARTLLAKLFGGRRVDALDALLLSSPQAPDFSSASSRLAARLPTFHAGVLLAPEAALDPATLRSFAGKGVPVQHRIKLKEADASLTDEHRVLYAQARLLMGIQYWRDEDFDASAVLLSATKAETRSKETRFAFALALGLRRGPDDVAALMLKNEGFGANFGDVRALDVVGAEDKALPIGARAVYDAAVIRQIAAPRDASAAYWQALATRYEQAEELLGDPTAKLEAHQRAKAAHATAKVLQKSAP